MPYFTDPTPIGPEASAVTLDDFPSSAGAALSAAGSSTFAGNPTTLGYNWLKLQGLNAGERLDRTSAEAAVKDAGVHLDIPESGYTAAALDLLIQRRHDAARRQDILDRAPTGVIPSTTRFAASLAAGIADPLNVAAAFVPVLGEARVASLFARAGEGLVGRSIARAGIGAVEGGVGTAGLELGVYPLHQQLGDDYGMADSLSNIAFGSLLGGALHVGGGAVGDLLRSGPHPSERFTGMSVDDIRGTLEFERQRATMPETDQARVLESFSPEMRRALGEGDIRAPAIEPPAEGEPLTFKPGEARPAPATAADLASMISPEVHQTALRTAVADLVNGRQPDVDAIVRLDPVVEAAGAARSSLEDVRTTALRQASPEATALGDFFAARAADRRQAEAGPRLQAATADLERANERVQTLAANLEQGGLDAEVTRSALASLQPWDNALADASNLGRAARAAAICGLRS